jgi:hypothetical protein
MPLLLLSLILLFSPFPSSGQFDFDEVRMYFYPEYFGPAFNDECIGNEDYIRVRASIKISISQKAEIMEIAEELLVDPLAESDIEAYFRCQFVIDFIKSGRIKRTVAISSMGDVRFDQASKVYLPNKRIKSFHDSYLDFFRGVPE